MNHKKNSSIRRVSARNRSHSLSNSVYPEVRTHFASIFVPRLSPRFHRVFLTLLLMGLPLFLSPSLLAEVPIPPLSGRVVDLTGTLDPESARNLESKLEAVEKRKGSQVAVLIVPTTGEETVEQFSIRVVDQWKLGRKGVDDGVLLLVAKDDHRVRIEVGYGLEGALTDLLTHRIISDIIIPQFKRGDYSGGIDAGVDAILAVIQGEPLPVPEEKPSESSDGFSSLPFLFIALFIVGFILRAIFGRFLGSLLAAGMGFILGLVFLNLIVGIFLSIALLFFLLSSGSRGGGGFFPPMGGGGFGGGSFGGGFSGGGGGFGGGGSSGSW